MLGSLAKLSDSGRTPSEVRRGLTTSFENHEPDERVFKIHWNTFFPRLLTLVFSLCLTAAAKDPSIDFSYAGYGGGGVAERTVAAVVPVRPCGGDDAGLLQGALNQVSALALTKNGFRGAVLLMPGHYGAAGRLAIRASGVVLRGGGDVNIVAAGKGHRTRIEIGSVEDPGTGPPR